MVIDDLAAPLEAIELELDAAFRIIIGEGLDFTPGEGWRWSTDTTDIYCFLEESQDEPGALPERTLEIVRPLLDLGFNGHLPPDRALAVLQSAGHYKQVRIAVDVHPHSRRRQSLLAIVTLHLEDLDPQELRGAIAEIQSATL
jgi:hypothetical protein